jgi:CDP-glucose 4,6-dehydratase
MQGFQSTFADKTVLVTGHTGFTGGWLTLWLRKLGAKVVGISLPPEGQPNLFEVANVEAHLDASYFDDINDYAAMQSIFDRHKPDYLFHLAAQALVRPSYADPLGTFATNIMGTAHILEAARQTNSVKAAVFVTTDKVYENKEWIWPYRETEPLGGKDPYSASKSGAEMVLKSYMESFFDKDGSMAVAVARGGNIIGGGDWSLDRLVPDFVRAISAGETLTIRNPNATRPWQHVLALCHGYLRLIEQMCADSAVGVGAWNLGPRPEDSIPVEDLIKKFGEAWKEPQIKVEPSSLKEAQLLALDSTKSKSVLKWTPPWSIEDVIHHTAQWYRDYYANPDSAADITLRQIEDYQSALSV